MYRIRLKDGSVKTLKSSGQVTTNKLGEAISIIGTCQDITDRTAKEQELLQRNQQLELTENTNEAGTWSWNPITGMFKWSENLYEIMDFDKNIPMNFEVLYTRIHPEDKHIVDNSMQLVQDTGLKHTFTHRIIINDGSIRTLEIIADIISNKANNQPEFIGTARDITSTLNIAQELNQKDQLLNFSEQLTTMGYWKYKPSMNDVYWSDNLYHIFDQSKKDDLTFETYFHKVHPDDKNFVKKRILQSIKDNKFYDFTHRIILKNNKIRVIQIIGKVTVNKIDGLQELLGTCLDITESHSKDLELSEKNYRLNVAEKMAMIGYWQWKTPINEVFWSDNLHAIYGHDKREPLTFETYINNVHKEDRKTVVANLKTAMKTGEFLESTYRIQLDDGSIKVIKSVGKITLDSKGEVLEMSGTCQDITEVKKKELALLQKNQQFNFAEKIANIGSWQWNPNTNKANWSDNHYRLYGIQIGTPLDLQTIYNQIHPDDLDPLKELTQEILSNKKFTETRFRIQLQSGDIKTLEVIGEVITDKAGSIVLLKGTSQDITYRIKAEQQIQEKNQLLSYAEEIAMMGSWHFDVHTNNLKWSDNLYKIYDLEVNSPMSMDIFYSKIHPDDIEIVKDQVQKCIEGDENIKSIFFRIILNNGKILSIESIAGITKNYLGEVVEIAGTAQDITERLKIEKDILEKNQLLNFTEQLSSIGHWKWDILQDVMEKSENLLKILDFEPEAKLDFNTYLKRVHPADREKVIDISQRIIETQKFNTFHHRIIMDDNSIKTIKIIGEVILDIDGNVIELIGSSQDITEQIEAQQKILDTNRSLEKSTITLTSKNKQLAEFNHITSHNLRSPVSNLNALLGLYRSTKNEDKKVEIFDKFEIVIDHLTETLNALIETISIKHSANEITKELCFEQTLLKTKEILAAELIESSAKISCDFSKAKNVKYNPIYLESIFLNLVSNSLKYRSEDKVPEISITSNTVNGRITLEFEDNGLGIDMKSNGHKLFGLNKVFHKHPDAKGIGLFLTKAQIIAMGGSISAKSKVGVGTTFFIILN